MVWVSVVVCASAYWLVSQYNAWHTGAVGRALAAPATVSWETGATQIYYSSSCTGGLGCEGESSELTQRPEHFWPDASVATGRKAWEGQTDPGGGGVRTEQSGLDCFQ